MNSHEYRKWMRVVRVLRILDCPSDRSGRLLGHIGDKALAEILAACYESSAPRDTVDEGPQDQQGIGPGDDHD